MRERWGALPLGEDWDALERKPLCVNCGGWCAPRHEHCDKCLMRIVRGINSVDRAVNQKREAQR